MFLTTRKRMPPEGVARSGGYADFPAIMKDPENEQYADILFWAAAAFDLPGVSQHRAAIKT